MKPKFYRKVLKNGMTIIFEKRDLPIVAVAFAVRNGGINEPISEKGISHFIEHMLYKGTKKRNAMEIAEEIEKKGGELNGFTDETITAYWCKMPSKHLNVALEVLSDMIKNPLFDEKELEKERKVIFEEIKMRRDNPHIHVLDRIQGCLYDGTMGLDLIGTFETMSSINRKKIVDKFKQIYQPNNMILGVVGNTNFEEIVKFAEKNFGNTKGRVLRIKFSSRNKSETERRKGIDQANLVFAYHVPLSTNKKSYAAEVLGTLMAGGMSSRLFSEIREKRNLAYSIKGDSSINKFFAYNTVYVGTTKQNVEFVKKIILEEFKKVAEDLTEKELNQIKEQLIGNYHISLEDSQMQLINLLLYEIDGSAKKFYDFEKNIFQVKLKDVKELAKIGKYSLFTLLPEK
ncbi:MAG: pitrilysin family protein [Candidatus Pacearchaeota archaeon]|nr:pitrilysin family protein [Candidatus Pacearchaeota archaeon]